MTLTLTWTLTDAEYLMLQRLVRTEGAEGETAEEYASRVGLKGLKGTLENRLQVSREQAIGTLTTAFDAADTQTQATALDTLGFEFGPDGTVRPKGAK